MGIKGSEFKYHFPGGPAVKPVLPLQGTQV